MSNSIGTALRVTSFGESHGRCIGVLLDGCPAGLLLDVINIQRELDRRRSGQSSITSKRSEEDRLDLLSGIYNGYTTGAPICMLIWNGDQESSKYDEIRLKPRPGHADYAARVRYGGFNDHRGGGRFSGRITAGFVMAGAIAKQLLDIIGVEVLAYTTSIGGIEAPLVSIEEIRSNTERTPVRCPHIPTAEKMIAAIEAARDEGDSLGGEVECVALNLPAGVGQPVFDTMEGDISKALFAVPAVKAVEFGAGKRLASMRGSEANDVYGLKAGKAVSLSNNMGGILGGLSNGMPIICRATFKPTPSIYRTQRTVDLGEIVETKLTISGRHDPCIVPRAVPVVEATVAMVLTDQAIRRGLIPMVLERKR